MPGDAANRRVLWVSSEMPWPVDTGFRMRATSLLRALTSFGSVDMVCIRQGRADTPLPELDIEGHPGIARGLVLRAPFNSEPRLVRWRRTFFGNEPSSIVRFDWTGVGRALREWAADRYDLIFLVGTDTHVLLHDALPDGPVITDLDDLRSSRSRLRRALGRKTYPRDRSARERLRGLRRGLRERSDGDRWAQTEREVAAACERVLVCSELDQQRLGVPNAVVVPNGFGSRGCPPQQPAAAGSHPVLMMIGLLEYGPNLDAAWFMVEEVLPAIRAVVPDVELRLVGRHDRGLDGIRGRPGVTTVGYVDDPAAEVAKADVVVVPIRYGGGTRLKVLEAFANRRPVVATTIGCEGLPVVDGRELLVADDPEAIASAVVRLLRDADLRARLTDAAFAMWVGGYTTDHATDTLASVIDRIDA
jgi:polysaccharide biosynthesis protein PslH